MIRKYQKIDIDIKSLERINETYIDSRYPSDLGLLPNGQPSQATAKEFSATATDIFNKIKRLIDNKSQK